MENESPQILRRARQHYSREEKQKHLQDQASSGLSAAAYCREQGLRYGNFLARGGMLLTQASFQTFLPRKLLSGFGRHDTGGD